MPSINRIRVNNVKYNFGTQGYDDFSMRMYGRNTLYDLANGGGKSVLMLLLMQNLIPNCTLDDKQPIEKLFRDPSNTVIHSLIEWKLDQCDIKDGFRYMTTGFAAKKAATTDEEREDGTAQIEYFNYCIFYRDYNKNDIINLPLVKENENISYKALRNYLHDLSRNDKNLMVQIFDRKGEYQRFIAEYGLYESHWEIIRGINKTEGHVRTYFESNYKTTRRVIEDLLIEEIIEKAYQAKTDRDTSKTESTVSLLMTIQEELKTLAEKKKGIELYDHERELVQLIIDRIESFMDLYKAQAELTNECAEMYVTLENDRQNRENLLESLQEKVDNAERNLETTRELIEILKITRDIQGLEDRRSLLDEREGEIKKLEDQISLQDKALRQLQAVQEYIEVKKAKQELGALDVDKNASGSEESIYAITANIRDRYDIELEKLGNVLAPVEEEIESVKQTLELQSKKQSESETELAVLDSRLEYIRADKKDYEAKLRAESGNLSQSVIGSPVTLIGEYQEKLAVLEQGIHDGELESQGLEAKKEEVISQIEESQIHLQLLQEEEKRAEQAVQDYKASKDKFKAICSIYGGDIDKPELLADKLDERITASVVKLYEMKERLKTYEAKENDVRAGRLVQPTGAIEKVKEYIATRHSMDAMFGMDYVAALPEDMRARILDKVPGLPYGIVVESLPKLLDDPGIMELDIDEEVTLYDRGTLIEAAVIAGEGVAFVRHSKEYYLDTQTAAAKLRIIGAEIDNLTEEIRNNQLVQETLREDLEFVRIYVNRNYAGAEQELNKLRQEIRETERTLEEKRVQSQNLISKINSLEDKKQQAQQKIDVYLSDITALNEMASLQDNIKKLDDQITEINTEKRRIDVARNAATEEIKAGELKLLELRAKAETTEARRAEIESKWERTYGLYYIEHTAYPRIDMDLAQLEKAFDASLGASTLSKMSLEKEKLLRDTLETTISRGTRIISELGIDMDDLEAADRDGTLPGVNEEFLKATKAELDSLENQKNRNASGISSLQTELARIEGSVDYAKNRLAMEFGDAAIERLETLDRTGDIEEEFKNTQAVLEKQTVEVNQARAELKKYSSQSKSNDDLLRLSQRIVESSGVNLAMVKPLESTDGLRDRFDALLLQHDKNAKDIDRAKADMLKVKMKVYDSLAQLGVAELAASIRDDVTIPDNKKDAEGLLKRLSDVIEIISLEKERIEKSLVSMEQLKDNFVDQCIERCLDVRSELDKLTKLSEITIDDKQVQMIRLSIPYVKDEFIKARMSEYIDRIVEEVDKKENDSDRQKYLNGSLAMKRLFSVIVTDMSKIRLMLYKRERIIEQSRYLRYEEAVGSTGQSQGIYIQFLISIINYIAGMYAVAESGSRSKTLFIDNPFGAAKDIYIWEPIFKLLEENSCQLIVPARGATPEITGRFDINYILGQQMTGKRTTTVVVEYSSKTKGEELEYKELDFEQQTFDFI